MNKAEISSAYRRYMLEKHGKKEWPETPRGVIYGYASFNIGSAIYSELKLRGTNITGLEKKEGELPLHITDQVDCFDFFVFNNGIVHLDWIENYPSGQIIEIIWNNLTATIASISIIAKQRMYSRNRTKIVVIGSMAYSKVLNASAPYCAAKAGLQHFVRCIAYELAPKGFEVFCVNPSNVCDTPMTNETIDQIARYRNISIREATEYWAAECPMGDFLTKDEIAQVVADLITEERKYLSGAAIDLIGGQR